MKDRRELAIREAEAFTERTLEQIRLLLANHSVAIVDHAIELHARAEAAEALLAELVRCKRGQPRTVISPKRAVVRSVLVPIDLLERCEWLVTIAKARTP